MALHCASRIGFLDYLYQKRHSISYTLGVIEEIPIAMCSSDHDFGQGLVIQENDQDQQTLPPSIIHTNEIQIFCGASFYLDIDPTRIAFDLKKPLVVIDRLYASPILTIFHPPS